MAASSDTDEGDDYNSLDDPDYILHEMEMDVDSLIFQSSSSESEHLFQSDDDEAASGESADEFIDTAPMDEDRANSSQQSVRSISGSMSDPDFHVVSDTDEEVGRPANPVPLVDLLADDDDDDDGDDTDFNEEGNDDDDNAGEGVVGEVIVGVEPPANRGVFPNVEPVVLLIREIFNDEAVPTNPDPTPTPDAAPSQPAVDDNTPDAAPTAPDSDVKKETSPKGNKRSYKSEDEGVGTMCSICLDSITNSGPHRIVSLRCGHVFGHNCVERWLRNGCTNGTRRCPDCNKRAKIGDIRILYADKLQVLDTTEIEMLKAERDKALYEKSDLKLKLLKSEQMCELRRVQLEELQHANARLKQANEMTSRACACRTPYMAHSKSKKRIEFLFLNMVEINRTGGCRVLAYASAGTLVVSQESTNPLFAGFGVRKLDGVDLRPMQLVHLHKKAIRDLAFHPTDGKLLLSASLDKTAKLLDTNTNTTVQTFNDENMLWSCCWSPDSQHQLLTGSQNGIVNLYDVRQPSAAVNSWRSPGDTSPVISLAPVNGTATQQSHIFSCRINAVQKIPIFGSEQPETVQSDGPLMSMSYSKQSQMLVSTCRPSQRFPAVRHIVSQMSSQQMEPSPCLNYLHTFNRGYSARVMSRAHQLQMRDGDSCVAAYNETSRAVELLSVNEGAQVAAFPHPSPMTHPDAIIDILSFRSTDQTIFLVSLTDKHLLLHELQTGLSSFF